MFSLYVMISLLKLFKFAKGSSFSGDDVYLFGVGKCSQCG